MKWSFSKPEQPAIDRFLAAQNGCPFSYKEVGDSLEKWPDCYDIDENEIVLGSGRAVFEAARNGLKNWQQFPADWCFVQFRNGVPGGRDGMPHLTESSIEKGRTVAMTARVLGIHFTNAARIVYTIDEPHRFGFAYGTLAAHVERGEELFEVFEDEKTGLVSYRIRAFSRPKFWLSRLNYPFARDLQRRFQRDSKLAMLAVVAGQPGASDAHPTELIHSKSMDWMNAWLFTLLGLTVWVATFFVVQPDILQENWGRAILLFAPLVLCPIAFELAENWLTGQAGLFKILRSIQLPAALFLTVSIWQPVGFWAVILAMPWVFTTVLAAFIGIKKVSQKSTAAELSIASSLIFLAVGGAWLLADRMDFQPLDFDPQIVLLTAVHFHFAGLVLPLATGLVASVFPSKMSWLASVGVVAGVPFTAIGITASQLNFGPWAETFSAVWMALAGLLVAVLHLKLAFYSRNRAEKWLFGIAGLCLAAGMGLAFLYGIRPFWPTAGLNIPWMRALHGSLNGFGFGLTAVVGWYFWMKKNRQTT